MKSKGLWALALTVAFLASALPVAGQGVAASPVVEEGGCLAYLQPLANGIVQAWIYCEEDGYYPAGTALHLVAVPADRPLGGPWVLTDLSAFPGGLLTGEYWVRQNAIAPVAVLMRALGPQKAVGSLLRTATRARAQGADAAQQGAAGSELSLGVRQEMATRSGQGSGVGLQEHVLTQTRQRNEIHADSPAGPTQQQMQQQTQQLAQQQLQQRAGNGQRNRR